MGKRRPIYEKIEVILKEEIMEKKTKFLSESYIIGRFKVSNTTARKVLDRLEEKGLIERKVGIGSIVVNREREKIKEIGILFFDIFQPDRPFISQMIKGIEKEAKEKKYHLHLYTTRGKSFLRYNNNAFYHLLTRREIDGVIILSPISSSDIRFLKKEKIPFVVTQNYYSYLNVPTVLFDYKKSIKKICEELLKKGYKKIGVITGPKGAEGIKRSRDFILKGYKEFLKENGLPFHRQLFKEREYLEIEGYKAMKEFYSLPEYKKPDLVLIFSSLLSTGAKNFLENNEEWKPIVISFVEEKIEHSNTIFIPYEELGRIVFKLLEEQIKENRIISNRIFIPLETDLKEKVMSCEM